VRLHRIHLEEDAGKAIHDRGATTLVDLNRAGVTLIESVTEADMRSSQEAHEYLTALKEILQYIGASDCDMEKGSLRCDVNVSVHREGEPWGTKVEIKNLNSFRYVQLAIDHEVERQIAAYESGDPRLRPVQETRLYDNQRDVTRTMRSKEEAHDYRYFAEPDLPPVNVSPAFLDAQRAHLPELPAARRRRYQEELGLSAYDAGVLTGAREIADFFEAVARLSSQPKKAANWISNEVLRAFGDPEIPGSSLDELPIKPSDVAELIAIVESGKVNVDGGRTAIRAMMRTGRRARDVVQELGLEQVEDEAQLEQWCRAALAGKDKVIADVKAGKVKALGALVGPVMKASQGKANAQKVQEIFLRLIEREH
jgi:aspartyl-tRNA(Asn)/glutamyl-tRNA(Gln) amidotransferase subunit B